MTDNSAVMPSLTIDSKVYEFSLGDILGSIGNITMDNDWWKNLDVRSQAQATMLCNQVLVMYNGSQPVILPTITKGEAAMDDILGLAGYHISPEDRSGVENLLTQYPSFRNALNDIYIHAKAIWEHNEQFRPKLLLEKSDGEQVLVVEVPGKNPEKEVNRLRSLMSWYSETDPQGVATLPIIFTVGYSE